MIDRLRSFFGRKFVRDTLALQIGKLLVAGIGALSAVIVFRLLGPVGLGVYGLAQSFLALLTSLDLTGLGASTTTRLGIAIGAQDVTGIRDLMAFYVKVSLLINLFFTSLLVVVGQPLAAAVQGDPRIGSLAAGLAFAGLADGLYTLIMIALQARRSMRAAAILQVANQMILSGALIAGALVSASPEGLVIARIGYSFTTMGIAVLVYQRRRAAHVVPYPPLLTVFRRAPGVPVRPYWRFGVANAVDRSIANLFLQIPIQLVGVFGGAAAVGFLDLALSGIEQARILTLALTENIAAVIPQAVGRGDYRALWRRLTRGLIALAAGSSAYYGAVAVAAPIVVALIVGDQWLPAIPAVAALAIFGAVTTTGGTFGPLYRSLGLMRAAIVVKIAALIVGIPLGALVIAGFAANGEPGAALGGAVAISVIFCLSVGMTAILSLSALRRRAQAASPDLG